MIISTDRVEVPYDFTQEFHTKYLAKLKDEYEHSRRTDYAQAYYYCPPEAEDIVLDVGCACSYFITYVADECKAAYGVDDLSSDPFAHNWYHTLKDFACYQTHKLNVLTINAARLPFQSDFFDKVYTFSALEHFRGIDDILCVQEIARVLKPGGVFCGTVDYSFGSPYPTPGDPKAFAYTWGLFKSRLLKRSGLIPRGQIHEDTLAGREEATGLGGIFFLLEKKP